MPINSKTAPHGKHTAQPIWLVVAKRSNQRVAPMDSAYCRWSYLACSHTLLSNGLWHTPPDNVHRQNDSRGIHHPTTCHTGHTHTLLLLCNATIISHSFTSNLRRPLRSLLILILLICSIHQFYSVLLSSTQFYSVLLSSTHRSGRLYQSRVRFVIWILKTPTKKIQGSATPLKVVCVQAANCLGQETPPNLSTSNPAKVTSQRIHPNWLIWRPTAEVLLRYFSGRKSEKRNF